MSIKLEDISPENRDVLTRIWDQVVDEDKKIKFYEEQLAFSKKRKSVLLNEHWFAFDQIRKNMNNTEVS